MGKKRAKFGVVGLGRFGQWWAQMLIPFGEVVVYDPMKTSPKFLGIKKGSLQEVAEAEVVFMLVPISAFRTCCLEIKQYLLPDTLVIDACSVKMISLQSMREIFGTAQPFLATHPLFGPDSVQKTNGLAGHKMVICEEQGDVKKAEQLFHEMRLDVFHVSAEEHDKAMARSQGLVHFLGRGLASIGLQQQELCTPHFDALLDMTSVVERDTRELFLDMHRYNPFARTIREELLQELCEMNKVINEEPYENTQTAT